MHPRCFSQDLELFIFMDVHKNCESVCIPM